MDHCFGINGQNKKPLTGSAGYDRRDFHASFLQRGTKIKDQLQKIKEEIKKPPRF
jgi:hypothetical protein